MKTITLEDREFDQLVSILGQTTGFPWVVTHPLIAKLQAQQPMPMRGNSDAFEERGPPGRGGEYSRTGSSRFAQEITSPDRGNSS